jgi:cytochrome d ubiquinol oxidase subunit II
MVMFWVAILAVSILLYVLLDGFDLGVGILFGFAANEERRRAMMSAVAPIWDGNETWLVVAGVVLWGAFPVVYATLLSAFYLPIILMLAGLILRGVAFEYRNKTERLRWIWDASFAGGSLVAAFMQGLTVGALVEQLPVTNGHYSGGEFGWFSPFAVLCGVGLCLGYSLLGACWLVRKREGDVREAAYRLIPYLAVALLVFSSSSSVTPWPKIFGSSTDGSSGRICLSSRRSGSSQRRWRRRAFAAAATVCRSIWSH